MFVDLTDIFTFEGKCIEKILPLEMNEFRCKTVEHKILEKSPINLTMSNLGVGKAVVKLTVDITLQMFCDRCLEEVPYRIQLNLERNIASLKSGDSELLEDNQDVIRGNELDIETLINNEILLNLPDKVLCKQDCKGICKICGQNLNVKDCGCDNFVPDPRMAAIKDIFNAKREV